MCNHSLALDITRDLIVNYIIAYNGLYFYDVWFRGDYEKDLVRLRGLGCGGADVKIMDRFFRHRELPDSENFSKPGFQLKTA